MDVMVSLMYSNAPEGLSSKSCDIAVCRGFFRIAQGGVRSLSIHQKRFGHFLGLNGLHFLVFSGHFL